MRGASSPNSHAERIPLIEDQFRFTVHKCRTPDRGIHLVANHFNAAFENAADDALLPPYLSRSKLAVAMQTRHLGTGARSAWRAVVCLAGTEDKVLAVDTRDRRWTEQ